MRFKIFNILIVIFEFKIEYFLIKCTDFIQILNIAYWWGIGSYPPAKNLFIYLFEPYKCGEVQQITELIDTFHSVLNVTNQQPVAK